MNMYKPFLLLVAFILMVMAIFDSVDGNFLMACTEGILSGVTIFIYEIGKEDDDESSS